MNIITNMSVELTPDQIERVITKAIQQETGRVVDAVVFNINIATTGYYLNERQTPEFSGCTVKLGDVL